MRKITLMFLLVAAIVGCAQAPCKIVDGGGSGPFKAEAVTEASLPGLTVYRPQQLSEAVTHDGPLPVVVFANGACLDTSTEHERLLTDLASHGYVAIALGDLELEPGTHPRGTAPNADMIRAIDWAFAQNADPASEYYRSIDTEYIALAGMSCGGAQVMANCADPRVKTYIMFNSGMGDMTMADASAESLTSLHGPVLYILGGESDIAYKNAQKDYDRIGHVPVAFASQLRCGHAGTFAEPYGGSFSRMAQAWLDWQFKDRRRQLSVFLQNNLRDFPDWTMRAKNFPATNEPFEVRELHTATRLGQDIWGRAYIPNTDRERMPLVIMAHGYNGNYQEPQPYAETLAMNGIASYVFDFPGGSNHSQSHGVTTDMTLLTEQNCIEDIARQAMMWEFVDTTRMALLGCSQGGLVAGLTVGAYPDLFDAVVFVYPAFMIPQTAPAMLERFDAANGAPQEVMGMKLGRQYYEYLNGMDVPAKVAPYRGKALIVCGDNDPVTAGTIVQEVAERLDSCQTVMIEGGQHGFPDYRHHQQAAQAIRDFLVREFFMRDFGHWQRPKFDPEYPDVHDPVMAYEDGKYYLFTTGMGIGLMSSADGMKTWQREPSPLNPLPEWAMEMVPAYKGHTWAPDIVKVGDRWYLYYSCSTFGKNISAIGVMTSPTLDPATAKWQDLGLVIRSQPGINDWNAIDPNIIIDDDGAPWLTFGSFWDGIQLVRLHADMRTPMGEPRTIARRRCQCVVAHNQPHANTNAIEAPFITKHGDYYYLWVSYDYCCQGLTSNYKTAFGRSKSVEGPYLDKDGEDMAQTGGTVLLGETGRYAGIGHCSVYDFDGQTYFIAHAYDKERHGASKLYIRPVRWVDGWPEIED